MIVHLCPACHCIQPPEARRCSACGADLDGWDATAALPLRPVGDGVPIGALWLDEPAEAPDAETPREPPAQGSDEPPLSITLRELDLTALPAPPAPRADAAPGRPAARRPVAADPRAPQSLPVPAPAPAVPPETDWSSPWPSPLPAAPTWASTAAFQPDLAPDLAPEPEPAPDPAPAPAQVPPASSALPPPPPPPASSRPPWMTPASPVPPRPRPVAATGAVQSFLDSLPPRPGAVRPAAPVAPPPSAEREQRSTKKWAKRAAVRRARQRNEGAAVDPEGDLPEVLVLDPDEIGREPLCELLRAFGFSVHPVGDAATAAAWVAARAYVAAFVDIALDGSDRGAGIDLCQLVHDASRRRAGPATLLVLVKAALRPVDRVRADLAGCDAALLKPVTRGQVAQALDSHGIAMPHDPRRT